MGVKRLIIFKEDGYFVMKTFQDVDLMIMYVKTAFPNLDVLQTDDAK